MQVKLTKGQNPGKNTYFFFYPLPSIAALSVAAPLFLPLTLNPNPCMVPIFGSFPAVANSAIHKYSFEKSILRNYAAFLNPKDTIANKITK
jgi:hypothetical protein